jgi:UDP-glucose 4-epimerase
MKELYAVTGGAGFIGSYVTEGLLQDGQSVLVIDDFSSGRIQNLSHLGNNENLFVKNLDIRDTESLTSCLAGVTRLIHLAGVGEIVPSMRDPEKYMSINVSGTASVMKAARENELKNIVYAASSSCYGDSPPTPTDEAAPIVLRHPYALSKYLGEVCAFTLGDIYGIKVNSIRIFNAYGRRVRSTSTYGAVLGVFIKQLISNAPLTIVGDGEQSRDFIHARDVADAFIKAVNSDFAGRVWNVGCGEPITINKLAEILGGDRIYIPDRPGEPRITMANIDRVHRELGWSPTVSFEGAVAEIISHGEEWIDAPLWDASSINEATKIWFKYFTKNIAVD